MKKISLPLLFFLLFFLLGVFYSQYRSPITHQPIFFPHKKHIEQDLECDFCHKGAKDGVFATFPSKDICAVCHSEPLTENKEEKKLLRYISSEQEIPWQKILRMPEHVYFSHKRHTVLGKIECTECHGEMSDRQSPPVKVLKRMRMRDCVDCHKNSNVTVACEACHR